MARSRRTPRVLISPMPFAAFQPLKPAPGGPATIFPWGRHQGLHASCNVRRLRLHPSAAEQARFTLTIKWASKILFSGFSGRKGPNSLGEISTLGVLRLRAISTGSRDKSVRRSAQDDVFVGVLKKNIPNKLALMPTSPISCEASWVRCTSCALKTGAACMLDGKKAGTFD